MRSFKIKMPNWYTHAYIKTDILMIYELNIKS